MYFGTNHSLLLSQSIKVERCTYMTLHHIYVHKGARVHACGCLEPRGHPSTALAQPEQRQYLRFDTAISLSASSDMRRPCLCPRCHCSTDNTLIKTNWTAAEALMKRCCWNEDRQEREKYRDKKERKVTRQERAWANWWKVILRLHDVDFEWKAVSGARCWTHLSKVSKERLSGA